jgi:hypothetical protein
MLSPSIQFLSPGIATNLQLTMIYITQLIYIHPGQALTFQEFEAHVMPLIEKYNGELLLRLRPSSDTFIAGALEQPYEMHLVSFHTEADWEAFKQNPERERFLHLKDSAVRKVLLIQGALI